MNANAIPQWNATLPLSAAKLSVRCGFSHLTVGLVNSMPDSALRSTERQFCALLEASSSGLVVNLKFYNLPGIKRSDVSQAHINACYEDFHSIADDPPDGLIVTGTEPRAERLQDEAFWPAMANLVNLAHDRGIPAIWSCLAAHAAVLEMNGIPRCALPRKLSGVFPCRILRNKHQIFHRMPNRWCVPHSRLNGLRRADLERNGYDIVSASSEAGIDMFVARHDCIQVFLQGHPEYEIGTLMDEYRRDVTRTFHGRRASLPDVPKFLVKRLDRMLVRHVEQAVQSGDAEKLNRSLDTIASHVQPNRAWEPGAITLYENWLAYVEGRKLGLANVCAIRA